MIGWLLGGGMLGWTNGGYVIITPFGALFFVYSLGITRASYRPPPLFLAVTFFFRELFTLIIDMNARRDLVRYAAPKIYRRPCFRLRGTESLARLPQTQE